MTHASHLTASDGTRLHYRYDDFSDPWTQAPLAFAQMEQRIPQAERIVYESARHNVFDYLPERCVADALAFLRKHFPEEGR